MMSLARMRSRRSKRLKRTAAESSTATLSQPRDSLSVDIDESEWVIMYPHFVDSRLVAPLERTDD
jgi:hypothetical protein